MDCLAGARGPLRRPRRRRRRHAAGSPRHAGTAARARECRAFVAGLALLRRRPPPQAPPTLVDADRGARPQDGRGGRSSGRVAAARGAAPRPARRGRPSATRRRPQRRRRLRPRRRGAASRDAATRWWWGTRSPRPPRRSCSPRSRCRCRVQGFRALPTAARRGGAGAMATTAQAESSSRRRLRADCTSRGSAGAPQAARRRPTARPRLRRHGAGARYVDVDGAAYVWLGERTPDRATLERGGHAHDRRSTTDGDAGTRYDVWRSTTDADVIFIRPTPSADAYVALPRVTRTLGGKRYALSTGDATRRVRRVAHAARRRCPTPTAADGSPTFAPAGTDDTGLPDLRARGCRRRRRASPSRPGTPSSDPAAGNPNWTWWVPKP